MKIQVVLILELWKLNFLLMITGTIEGVLITYVLGYLVSLCNYPMKQVALSSSYV